LTLGNRVFGAGSDVIALHVNDWLGVRDQVPRVHRVGMARVQNACKQRSNLDCYFRTFMCARISHPRSTATYSVLIEIRNARLAVVRLFAGRCPHGCPPLFAEPGVNISELALEIHHMHSVASVLIAALVIHLIAEVF